MSRVGVLLGERSYDIHIGPGLLARAGSYCGPLMRRRCTAIITDENIAPLHLESLRAGLEAAGIHAETLILPAGEHTKSWPFLQQTVDFLLNAKIERGDLVIAFGGGVIGDLAGFAAAILRRGVGLVQIPTSLLAQVDSSVGGKTGINSSHGKNLIGAFHQPQLVLIDTDALKTLPRRELLAGYGEMVKYGLLGDADFFYWLEENAREVLNLVQDPLEAAIAHSCRAKAGIVARDERESGERALLNLGHTFGHALEAAAGYSDQLLHGEGVAIGIALAFETSMRLGLCPQEVPSRVRAHFRALGLKTSLADISAPLPGADTLIDLMGQDKKVLDGQIGFILARDIGDAFVMRDVELSTVRELLSEELQRHAEQLRE